MPPFSKYDSLNVSERILLDANDGSEGAGSGTEGDDDQASKEAEVQKKIDDAAAKAAQAERAKSKKQLQKRDEEISELKTHMQKLEELVTEFATRSAADETKNQDGQVGGEAGALKVELAKQTRELEKLRKDLEAQTERARKAEAERLAGEQRRRIQEVLTEIKCRDLTVGERFLSPIVTRDEDDGELYVRLIDGELAPLTKDSADSVLPDYLKLTEVLGGAGSVNGSTKKQETQKELDTARKELDRLANVARQTNTNSDIQKYQRQKRVVQQIEANVKNAR